MHPFDSLNWSVSVCQFASLQVFYGIRIGLLVPIAFNILQIPQRFMWTTFYVLSGGLKSSLIFVGISDSEISNLESSHQNPKMNQIENRPIIRLFDHLRETLKMFTRVRLLRSSEYEPISNRFQMDSEWKVACLIRLSQSNDLPDHLDQMLIGWTPIGRGISIWAWNFVGLLSMVSRPWCILQCKLLNASKWKPLNLNVNLHSMKFTEVYRLKAPRCGFLNVNLQKTVDPERGTIENLAVELDVQRPNVAIRRPAPD